MTAAPPSASAEPGRLGRYLTGAVFLAPALLHARRVDGLSGRLHDHPQLLRPSGFLGHWVGFDNYKTLFTTSTLTTAIKNNAIWVAVVPALVTAIGLIFAVLTERVRWAVAFKTAVFLPMAISAFATGVTWRIMYQQDPGLGAINALGKTVSRRWSARPASSRRAFPSTPDSAGATSSGAIVCKTPSAARRRRACSA